jgi:site-specific recombinase XerD
METKLKMQVAELAETVGDHLASKGYSMKYRRSIGFIMQEVVNYCAECGEKNYSSELGQQFLARRIKTTKRLGPDRLSVINRAVQMMSDYQQFGTVIIRRRSERRFPEQFEAHCEAYVSFLMRKGRLANTIKSIKHSMFNFTDFLDGIGVTSFSALTLAHMNEYIKCSLCNYCQGSAALRLRDAKDLLTHLYAEGVIADDYAAKTMKISVGTAPVFLPSAFKHEDIEKLISTIDRGSPTGKRAYAVILLVAKTGIRLSDVQNLKFSDINWDDYSIRTTQVKTKEPLVLPLTKDVGWALIDYIEHGRPVSDSPHIFLRERAPYIPLTNFDNILVKHLRLAGISTEYVRHHGLHALRHGLGTTLLEQGVSLDVIQPLLGHVNMSTTKRYAATNVSELRGCALEVPTL